MKRTGLTAKTKERLRAFEDPQTLGRLLLLPAELMTEATKTRRAPQKAALLAQNAVAIELLLMTALRKRNLTMLELNTHVFLGGDPKRPTAFITIPEQETKNGSPLEFELPLESARLLKAYIDRFLPALAEPGQSHLFPGQAGRAKRPNSFGERVTKVVAERVGARVHVHLFRHLTSKVFLDANPGLYEAVRRVLGHRYDHDVLHWLRNEGGGSPIRRHHLGAKATGGTLCQEGSRREEQAMRLPHDDPRRSMPFDEWPAPDRDAWHEANRIAEDILDEPGGLAHVKPLTRERYKSSFGRYLAFLHRNELLLPTESPPQRLNHDRVTAYIRSMQDRVAPTPLTHRIVGL